MHLHHLPLLAPILFSIFISAQNTTIPLSPLTFQLLRCQGPPYNTPSGVPPAGSPPIHEWGLISLESPNGTLYTLPLNADPYHRWEGFNTSAFFFSRDTNKTLPYGFARVEIPEEAKEYKAYVAAGRVVFEGEVFPCENHNGVGLFQRGWVFCSLRYTCKQRAQPLRKNEDVVCPVPNGPGNLFWDRCYPEWRNESGRTTAAC